MFDCPEQNHTSPIRMSFSSTSLRPLIFIVYGPPAFMAGSDTVHFPSAPAGLSAFLPLKFTLTFSPGEAQPQMVRRVSRCSTMLSPIRFGSLIWAVAVVKDPHKQKEKAMINRVCLCMIPVNFTVVADKSMKGSLQFCGRKYAIRQHTQNRPVVQVTCWYGNITGRTLHHCFRSSPCRTGNGDGPFTRHGRCGSDDERILNRT